MKIIVDIFLDTEENDATDYQNMMVTLTYRLRS